MSPAPPVAPTPAIGATVPIRSSGSADAVRPKLVELRNLGDISDTRARQDLASPAQQHGWQS
jgi:hypothetical protein